MDKLVIKSAGVIISGLKSMTSLFFSSPIRVAPSMEKPFVPSSKSKINLLSLDTVFLRDCKEPSKRISPLPITITLLHRVSISSISWVVSITVTPFSLFSFFINSLTANLDMASSPIVGSSRKSICGE